MLSSTLDAATAEGDDRTAARALEGMGTVATLRGQEATALDLFEQAIERGGRPDPAEHEPLYMNTARLRSFAGDAGGAVALLEECLVRLRAADEPDAAMVAHYSITLSYAFADAGQYGRASTVLGGVLQDGAEDLDTRVRSRLYYALTRLNMNIGRTDQAIEYSEKNLDATIADGSPGDIFAAYLQCAHVRLDAHETEQAGAYLEQARRRLTEPLSAVDEGFLLVEEARHALQVRAPRARPGAGQRSRRPARRRSHRPRPERARAPRHRPGLRRHLSRRGRRPRTTARRSCRSSSRPAGPRSGPRRTAGTASSCAARGSSRRRWRCWSWPARRERP